MRALLDAAFARLGLIDPEHHLRAAIARYPLDVINTHAKSDPAPLVAAAARRVHATHRVSYRDRQDAVRVVVANVVPLS